MSAVLKQQCELRPIAQADLAEVMAIENAVYAFPWTEGNFRDSLAAGYGCWAYARGGEMIGYAVLAHAADEAHLLNLSIAARHQRQGHGGRLLEQLCELTRERGGRLFVLEVRPSNALALRLYERHGFRRVGLRRGYYPARAGREDALVLALRL